MNRFLKPSNRSRSAQHDVNFMILTMAFLFCSLSQTLLAQEGCYQRTHSGGVTAMNKKEYDKAIQWFEQAKGCPDKPSNNDLESLIKKCQTKKKELADNKRKAEEQRRQKAEEKRIQEEREQWEREQEEAQEAELAKRAYMNIVGMKFFNEDVDGERISEEGEILYSTDVKFLVPVVCYNGLADEARMVTLCCKIFKPNGDLETFVDSPEGYSFFQDVIVLPDANNELRLGRWGRKEGGTFIPGTYTFEIYTVDSILVRTERIPLMEKIELPTSALITLISEDSQANIYVDDVYQGFGSQSVSLTYGNHVVECRRTHYRSAQKQINVTADSDGKTIRIDKPQPIYGSLRVDSKPKAAEVFVDGKIQGETPIELPQLLIGEHQLKLIKKGYLDVNKNITIYENSTMPIDVKMTRQKTDNRFASFFMDGVYGNIGNAEPMVGGQLAFCKRHVGFYGQFLYGIDYGSYTATGGLVFRLTKDYIDIQMNVGMGYGSLLKYSSSYYEGYFHSDQLLFDVGGRLGWRTGWKWSMFDIMGGCIMSIDGHVCPYVGVGTALSLAAIITGLSIAEF